MAAIYEAQVYPKREDTMLRALPGALALMAGVALVTGVFDEGVRTQLWPALVGCLVVAIVGGLVHFRIRRRHTRTLRVERGDDGWSVKVGALGLDGDAMRCGVAEEWAGRRRYLVAWVAFSGPTGTVIVRQGLGIAHARPEWPGAPVPAGTCFTGDPVPLHRAVR